MILQLPNITTKTLQPEEFLYMVKQRLCVGFLILYGPGVYYVYGSHVLYVEMFFFHLYH